MNFYVCSTPYHLFISLIHMYGNNEKGIIYLTSHEENTYKLFKMYSSKLNNLSLVEKVIIRKRNIIKERLKIEELIDLFEYNRISGDLRGSFVYIFPWNPYSLYSISSFIYKKAINVSLIEDGSNLYAYPKPKNIPLFIKKYLYGISTDFYKNEKVKEILVQFPDKYPKHMQSKIKKLNLDIILDKVDGDAKKKIISVFIPWVYVDKLLTLNNENNLIILTQPLSEDGYTTEENKIQLYKDIIENYKGSYDIILKKHPREKTTYHFDNVLELDGFFPSEIFNMLGIKFKKAIGICTSAIHNINADEKLNTDEDFLNRRKH